MTDLYDNADIYDLQYEAYRDDVPYYVRLATDESGPVLELGSGTGRLTEALLNSGQPVTGVEKSAAMLQRARARLDGRAHLIAGDIRQLPDAGLEAGSFRLVVAPFNVLMHLFTLPDQDACLRGVHELLEPGGMLALDLYLPRLGQSDVLRLVPEWSHVAGDGGQVMLLQEHDLLRQLVTSTYQIDSLTADGFVRRRVVSLHQRYYQPFELERALRSAGFNQIRFEGGFDRSRLQADSDQMVVTCRRPRRVKPD